MSDAGAALGQRLVPGDSLDAAIRALATRLRVAGVSEAATDARMLVLAAAKLDRVAYLRDPDRALGPAAALAETWFGRRAAGEPVSRILGEREFWGLTLEIGPATLDPRPETEELVSAALERLPDRRAPVRILDLGTGSGALLCALLLELPNAAGVGVDRSPAACEKAHRNLRRHGLLARCSVVACHWDAALDGRFDVIVSNPPYVIRAGIEDLAPEVRDHDPRLALDGGEDGLDAFRALGPVICGNLADQGVACVEIGAGQASAVRRLLESAGLRLSNLRRDLAGHERVLVLEAPRSRP